MLFIWTPGHICENVKYMQSHKPMHFLHLHRLGWGQPTISHPEFSSNSETAMERRETSCDGLAFQINRVKPMASS